MFKWSKYLIWEKKRKQLPFYYLIRVINLDVHFRNLLLREFFDKLYWGRNYKIVLLILTKFCIRGYWFTATPKLIVSNPAKVHLSLAGLSSLWAFMRLYELFRWVIRWTCRDIHIWKAARLYTRGVRLGFVLLVYFILNVLAWLSSLS